MIWNKHSGEEHGGATEVLMLHFEKGEFEHNYSGFPGKNEGVKKCQRTTQKKTNEEYRK